jgi:hypothetical protein
MRHSNVSFTLSIVGLTLALATWSVPAHAYIDPVTGSFLVQGLIAGVMAIMAGVRSIRQRIVGLFRRRRENDQA